MVINKSGIVALGLSLMTFAHASEGSSVETFWIWVALFALGAVGVAILFISSQQAHKMQTLHQMMLDKQLQMEKNQNILLTNMSENIHNMAKLAIEKAQKNPENTTSSLTYGGEILANVENRLLDVTNDLIDFLRLKSRKIEIINEEFNINNVLNELSG